MGKKRKDYVPTRNGDKVPWAGTLKTLGESASDVTAVQDAAQGVKDEVGKIDAAKADCENKVKAATDTMNAHIKVIRQHAQRMKTHADYTAAIGNAMGIEGDEHAIDLNTVTPELSYHKAPNGYEIRFNLLGYFPSVHVYRKRPADAGFIYIGNDTSSPYLDTDPMVDGTQYHAFYVLNDVEVGVVSNEITITL
jgi:hypothetical protein